MLHPIPESSDAPKLAFVVWMQRRLIRELCRLPQEAVVDVEWLQGVWRRNDPAWVRRFWGQIDNGPRGRAIKEIAKAPPDIKRDIKQTASLHFQLELRYFGVVQGQFGLADWEKSEAHRAFKKLMTSFYEDWLRGESIDTPTGPVSVKSLYDGGLASAEVCPYCDMRLADDNRRMDHFFPDSEFPSLSVSLYNLIPSCESCNGISHKHNNLPFTPNALESFADWFHPHFRTAARKVAVLLTDHESTLTMQVRAIDPVEQPRVDSLVSLLKLNWASAPARDVRSFKRQVVVDLRETPSSRDVVIAALDKWAEYYEDVRGEEPEAIKRHGCFTSMRNISAIVTEIEEQLKEDQRIRTPPSNGTQRKA